MCHILLIYIYRTRKGDMTSQQTDLTSRLAEWQMAPFPTKRTLVFCGSYKKSPVHFIFSGPEGSFEHKEPFCKEFHSKLWQNSVDSAAHHIRAMQTKLKSLCTYF